MRYIKPSLFIIFATLISGCSQFNEINQKIAHVAGELIKIRDANKQYTSDSFISKRDIDTLYTRIKREFDFQTIEESLNGCSPQLDKLCRWKESAVRSGGHVHEKTPGVYYKMGHSVGKDDFYVEITLEKEGKNTLVSYATRGSQEWGADVKARLQKTIK